MRPCAVPPSARAQSGVSLVESMIAILLFALGALGVVGMYASSTAFAGDAQYRTEATALANEALQLVAMTVRKNGALADVTDLQTFALNATGDNCGQFAGPGAVRDEITAWQRDRVRATRVGLPGSQAEGLQQIRVERDAALSTNRVTVTLCWRVPSQNDFNRHVLVGYVQ
jgi:type IV pilus assembly protein PilV